MTGEVTYAAFLNNAQANLWYLISNDATVKTFTTNVLDGIPRGLTEGTGFPYIIVPTPVTGGENYLTFKNKKDKIIFKVPVYDRKESVLRPLCDAVRNACQTNTALFRNSYGMLKFIAGETTMAYVMTPDRQVVYEYTLNLTYEWVAWS